MRLSCLLRWTNAVVHIPLGEQHRNAVQTDGDLLTFRTCVNGDGMTERVAHRPTSSLYPRLLNGYPESLLEWFTCTMNAYPESYIEGRFRVQTIQRV